jgi:prepilin-type N-terminal cleavage/methylation domain-containing protein
MEQGIREDEGFTLLEVLVAMMVLAISYAVLAQTVSSAVLQTRSAQTLVQASQLAKQLQAQITQMPDHPSVGRDRSSGLDWTVAMQPIEQSSPEQAGHLSLVTIRVRLPDRPEELVSMRTIIALRSTSP